MKWTKQMIDQLCDEFPHTMTKTLAAKMGLSERQVTNKASALKVKKMKTDKTQQDNTDAALLCFAAKAHGGLVSPEQIAAFKAADAKFVAIIERLKEDGIPQGLIVSLLHAHAHNETANMLSES